MSLFSQMADKYDAWYETKRGQAIMQQEMDCALSLYRPEPGDLLIDIGCGSGIFSRLWIELGARLVGIDESSEMIGVAQEKDDQGLYRVMDMHELDYPDDYFDAAVSSFALEFTADPASVLSEARRVVKPGGSILMGTISSQGAYGKDYIKRGKQGHPIYSQANFHALEDILKLYPDEVKAVSECVCFGPHDEVRQDCPEGEIPSVFFIHWIKSMSDE